MEFPGAVYHVTSRGNEKKPVFKDDHDRSNFLNTLQHVNKRYNWICHAYCLMANHFHLLIETPDGNLSPGMRQLNGVYTQLFNKRHGRTGHLFQGRFKSVIVEDDAGWQEVARYVHLNPVRWFRGNRGLYSVVSTLFHVGLILVPIFLAGHIRLWQRGIGIGWAALPASLPGRLGGPERDLGIGQDQVGVIAGDREGLGGQLSFGLMGVPVDDRRAIALFVENFEQLDDDRPASALHPGTPSGRSPTERTRPRRVASRRRG